MVYYAKHVFLCTNQKSNGKPCCANSGGVAFFDHIKAKLQALHLQGPGQFRVSKSGCLGRCALGPTLVIYPEGVWYKYSSLDDLDEIITNHLIGGARVERLLIDS